MCLGGTTGREIHAQRKLAHQEEEMSLVFLSHLLFCYVWEKCGGGGGGGTVPSPCTCFVCRRATFHPQYLQLQGSQVASNMNVGDSGVCYACWQCFIGEHEHIGGIQGENKQNPKQSMHVSVVKLILETLLVKLASKKNGLHSREPKKALWML